MGRCWRSWLPAASWVSWPRRSILGAIWWLIAGQQLRVFNKTFEAFLDTLL
jgi:hypothetical protein